MPKRPHDPRLAEKMRINFPLNISLQYRVYNKIPVKSSKNAKKSDRRKRKKLPPKNKIRTKVNNNKQIDKI